MVVKAFGLNSAAWCLASRGLDNLAALLIGSDDRFEVIAVERRPHVPHDLDVLLRHRPRSICPVGVAVQCGDRGNTPKGCRFGEREGPS